MLGGDGDEVRGFHPEPAEEFTELGADAVEDLGSVPDQVHLVHGDDDLPEPEERKKEAVPASLLAQALLGVDKEDRGIGACRPGDHVLQELLVPWGVDDRERAAFRVKGHAGRVHRYVLRLLFKERVQEERVLELHPLGLAGGLDALRLSVGHRVRVEEEPTDKGGFPMVDVAHDHKVEVVRARALGRRGAVRRERFGRRLRGKGGF